MNTDQSIAQTILQQLGGKRFVAMTGASSFASGDSGISFRLPARQTKQKGSAMRITLEPTDTYHLELLKIVNWECVVVDERRGVYCDNLTDIFTDMTGLFTSLAA